MPEYVWIYDNTSVIRQKGEFQNRYFKKTKHVKFSEKQTFLTPWYAHVRKIWRALFSWNTRFEIRLFALLTTISFDGFVITFTSILAIGLRHCRSNYNNFELSIKSQLQSLKSNIKNVNSIRSTKNFHSRQLHVQS